MEKIRIFATRLLWKTGIWLAYVPFDIECPERYSVRYTRFRDADVFGSVVV